MPEKNQEARSGYLSGPATVPRTPPPGRVAAMGPYRGQTYYGIPPLKHSHYKWRTGTSFFLTGIAAGSQFLSTLFDFLGSDDDRHLVTTGRYIAMAGGVLSPGLLISSLHNRRRWYNMLRIYKKTSPMSVGIWAITPFSMLSTLSAGIHFAAGEGYAEDGDRAARAFAVPAALLGGLVMSYMGTELEETQMPLWAKCHPLLAPFYSATGMANAAETLLLYAETKGASGGAVKSLNRLALVSGAAEMALGMAMISRWNGRTRSLLAGRSGNGSFPLFLFAGTGMVMPFLLRLLAQGGDDQYRRFSPLSSLARLGGGLLLQLGMVYGGRESGQHPRDYFEYTRPQQIENRQNAPFAPDGASIAGNTAVEYRKRRYRLGRRQVKKDRKRPFTDSAIGWGAIFLGVTLLIPSIQRRRGD